MASGDTHRSFGERLEDLIPELRRFAVAICHNRDTGDDLVQEALVKALANEGKFDPETNLRAWVFTILQNVHRSNMRTWARRGQHLDVDDVVGALSHASSQGRHMEVQAFRLMFQRLPRHEGEAILLVCLEEFSYEDAAGILGVQTGTVKSRVSRGRKRLQHWLDWTAEGKSERAEIIAFSPAGATGESGVSQAHSSARVENAMKRWRIALPIGE